MMTPGIAARPAVFTQHIFMGRNVCVFNNVPTTILLGL